MIHAAISPSPTAGTILLAAARSWREGRDRRDPVQPRLYAMLAPHDCTILAPVLDSLLSLCERGLGRMLAVGKAATLSDDEHLLLGMLDGSRQRPLCAGCPQEIGRALDGAIRSTRIMMALALGAGRADRSAGLA